MDTMCWSKGSALLIGLALLLVLAACGPSVESLQAGHDVQGLIAVLEDPEQGTRTRTDAALALGELGDAAAVEPLIRYLQDCVEALDMPGNNDEWQAAHDAVMPVSRILGELHDARAVEPMIEMLDDYWGHDAAVKVLGMVGGSRAIVPLIETVDHELGVMEEETLDARWVELEPVVLGLAADATPETLDVLREALPGFRAQEAGNCRKYRLALDALAAAQDPGLETLYLSLLEPPDPECDASIPYRLAEMWDFDAARLRPYVKLGYPADFTSIYFLMATPAPKPLEVDFATIYGYHNGTQVVITGRLSAPSVVVCDSDCNADLRNPSGEGQVVLYLHRNSQMDGLQNPYDEEDLRVHMDNGEIAGHGSVVRITGTICDYGSILDICDVTRIEPVE